MTCRSQPPSWRLLCPPLAWAFPTAGWGNWASSQSKAMPLTKAPLSNFEGMYERAFLLPSEFAYKGDNPHYLEAYLIDGCSQGVLRVMDRLGLAPHIHTLNAILNAHASARMPERAEEILRQCESWGYKVWLTTWSLVVSPSRIPFLCMVSPKLALLM